MAKQKAAFSDVAISSTISIATALIVSASVALFAGYIDAKPKNEPQSPFDLSSSDDPSHQAVASEQNGSPERVTTTMASSNTRPAVEQPDSSSSPDRFPPIATPDMSIYANKMTLETPALSFLAEFPEGAQDEPAYRRRMEDMHDYRNRLRKDADAARRDQLQIDAEFRPWSYDLSFSTTARAGSLISILGQELSDTGGAHPNLDYRGYIANAETGDILELSNLFTLRKQEMPALVIAMCEALKVEKIARIGEATIHGEPIVCRSVETESRLVHVQFVLAPSTIEDRFGGVTAWFPPYTVGAFAEGPYSVTIPQGVFAPDLKPTYRNLFEGEPR